MHQNFKTMPQNSNILSIIAETIKLPNTTEHDLLQGRTVDWFEFLSENKEKLIRPPTKLCKSHIKSLAESILRHQAVFVPILVEKEGDFYKVVDGQHRVKAIEIVTQQHPGIKINAQVKTVRMCARRMSTR